MQCALSPLGNTAMAGSVAIPRNIKPNNLYKNSILDMHEIKLYIELYFRKKIEQTKSNRYYEFYSYFNHKFNESYKYNLDLESCFIELNAKLLNE